jgi:hypothetical protein
MANTRLQFTYLWADEEVMQADFAKKFSQDMTNWAVDFYARYGFDIDVNPPSGLKPRVLPLSKFALQKTGGVRPDMRPSEERNRVLEERRRRIEEERERLRQARDQAEAANNGPEADRLRGLINDLDRRWQAVMNQIIASFGMDENNLRELLMVKFLADRILHPERFTVVFCRFRFTSQMQMRLPQSGATGQTYGKVSEGRIRFYGSVVLPLWSDRFAIIDPFRGERRSVAHEAVHAAGHDHPVGQYLQSVEKRYRGRRLPGQGFEARRKRSLAPSYDDPVFDFDEIPHYAWFRGGYDDGPPDDLMNYTLDDPEPSEVNLRPAHVDLMSKAYFAKTP